MGVSRQQYQRLESKGNPRLDTLQLIAEGLNSELMLIPNEKLNAVMAVLEGDVAASAASDASSSSVKEETGNRPADDPWKGLLGGDS